MNFNNTFQLITDYVVSVTEKHVIHFADNGQVFTWGSNSFGQLGVSYIAKSSCPVS